MEKNFIRVRSNTDWAVSLILIAAGALLVALPTSVSVNILGFFMVFAGLILLFILRTGYKDAESGEKFRKKEKFFPQSCKESISSALNAGKCPEDMSQEDKGTGLRIDTYYNRKSGHAYVMLLEYIPYKYMPASEVHAFGTSQIEKLIG